jgi:hypothetical protein
MIIAGNKPNPGIGRKHSLSSRHATALRVNRFTEVAQLVS